METIRSWFRKKDKSTLEQYLEAAIIILPIAFLIRTFIFGLYIVPSGSMETTMLIGERFISDKLTPWITPIKRGEIIAINDPTYPYSQNPFKNLFERYVWGPSNWTKRVIGIPGDHVKGVIEDGKPVIYLNGVKLDEPYINKYPLLYMWKKSVPTVQDLYLGNVTFDIRSFDPSKPFDQQPFYYVDPAMIIRMREKLLADAVYSTQGNYWLNLPQTPLANGDDVFDIQLGENEYWAMGDNRKGSRDSRDWGKLDGKLIHGRIKFCFFSMQYTKPWSFLFFDESWWIIDLLLHPVDFWHRIRWDRCLKWLS